MRSRGQMMNTSKWIRQIMILAAFALVAVAAAAADTAGERYIVILKSRSGPAPDIARLGGTITFRQEEQVNVTLPREGLTALRADPLVRYVQAVAGAGVPLIGEPEEPTPGSPHRLVPHATAGNQSWSRSYTYDDAGNITNIGDQQFVYDALGRLNEMATSGTPTEQYEYDRYGNQTKRTTATGPQQIPTDTATNRLPTGYTYDRAGNVTSGDGYTLTYDALGQVATKTYTASTTYNETYIYTAGEERIGVQTSNSAETSSWWYWSVRDEGGKVLRQYRSSALDPTQEALWIEDYVYRDGLLVGAERPPTMGGRRHFHLDHLGSPRLITSNDGQIVSMHDYLPFGGETTSVWQEEYGGFDREDPMKFTGHERDYAGGFGREDGHAIDYMHARYYSPTAGRFLSVDPVLETDAALKEPQRWNRYAYVMNNPMNHTDPTGKVVEIDANADVRRLKVFLTETMRRPTGRADVMAVINDPNHKLRMTSATLTSPAQVHMNMQSHGSASITFGQTVPNGNVQLQANGTGQFVVTGSTMTIDTNAVSQHHTDRSGVTTTAHEFDHVNDLRAGGVAQMKSGDLPSSATGPAEQHGQKVAAERTDLTAAQARQLVDQLIPVRP
jgi:RHS repeat-associated protein